MKKIGFLFGAGAEVSYGMPSGGRFALDIFRQPNNDAKDEIRKMRKSVNAASAYAANWLPQDYQSKNISAYTQRVFDTIIKDTIRSNRSKIISKINNFDELAEQVIARVYNNGTNEPSDLFTNCVNKELKINPNNININQKLRYNHLFEGGNDLFKSKYLSIFLSYYQNFNFDSEDEKNLFGDLLKSVFQLHIGALSSKASSDVEDTVFEKQDLDVDFFDDLGGSLNVNYEAAGISGLKLLSSKKFPNSSKHNIIKFLYLIVEQMYSDVLDYKSLIDSNWHYLYLPKTEWGKFCKMSVFLYTVQKYIKEKAKKLDSKRSGYYTELKEEIKNSRIIPNVIGTTNYNSFIQSEIENDVLFLNGGVDIYYDPYMNTLIDDIKQYRSNNQEDPHIIVPLLFTQSGTKPMTSIDMSKKYVNFYDGLKESEAICSIGFGFNPDDEHINGIIRTLIERDNKILYIVDYSVNTYSALQNKYAKNLKVSKSSNIKIGSLSISKDEEIFEN